MALTSILPLPKNPLLRDRVSAPAPPASLTETSFEPPPYGKRERWNPRSMEDFGDGGAFPECHILQYPLGMGRDDASSQGVMIPLKVDAEGNVKFDSIVKQGLKGRSVHATAKDQLGLQEVAENDVGMLQDNARDELDSMQKPDEDEMKTIAEKTRAALAIIVDQKQAATQPTHIPKQNLNDPVFIRYTPNSQGEQFNSGARQRIIRLQEMPTDPLDPPKFMHKKLPAAPGSPPAPVMHSPPRKITVQDQQNWKIPPSISNWKNIKGYTMALDKRLAADGRTMQEVQINDKFAKLSEALFVAERTARAEIEKRAKVAQAIQKRKKNETEELLEKLARQARNIHDKAATRDQEGYDEVDKEGEDDEAEPEEAAKARGEREELRRERRREMKREFRQEQRKQEKAAKVGKKKAALTRGERDISEKIALGENVSRSSQSLFDQRLFNQSEGMDQGFSAEDAYDVYSKPLFARGAQSGVYRPKPVPLEDSGDDAVKEILEKSTSRFKPDRGFEGAEEVKATPRDKPVAFERDEADPFGIGRMLTAAKQGGRHTLDKIGSQGHMSATGGSSQGADKYRESSSRRRDRIGFEESDSGKKKSRK